MNREHTLPARPAPFASMPDEPPRAPVLIQVPRITVYSHASARRQARPVRSPRRRLRREVRWAGYAALVVLPLALSALGYWEGRQAALLEMKRPRSAELEAAPPPPLISLSIEPVATHGSTEPEAPVVFPGYLLPDDGSEEAAHAGD